MHLDDDTREAVHNVSVPVRGWIASADLYKTESLIWYKSAEFYLSYHIWWAACKKSPCIFPAYPGANHLYPTDSASDQKGVRTGWTRPSSAAEQMPNAAHAQSGLDADSGITGEVQQCIGQSPVEPGQTGTVQGQASHEAGDVVALEKITLIPQLIAPAQQTCRYGLHTLSILILDGTAGKTAVPLLDKTLENEALRREDLVPAPAFKCGRGAHGQPMEPTAPGTAGK